MRKEWPFIMRIFMAAVLLVNIPILLIGFGFTGKELYVAMIIVFFYSIYSIFFKTQKIFDFGAYIAGIIYSLNDLHTVLFENDFMAYNVVIVSLLTTICFLILLYLLLKNLKDWSRDL